jgi:hypothetical protein
MAIVSMTPAVAGNVAVAAEYNKLISNITDLDTRTTAVEAAVGGGTGEVPRKGGEWYMATSQTGIAQGTLLTAWTANGTPSGVAHSAGTFTVTDAGLYVIVANVRFITGDPSRYVMITGNGATGSGTGDTWGKGSANNTANVSVTAMRRLTAGAGIKVWAYVGTSTGSVGRETTTGTADLITGISVYKVGN